jgi:hypothetical protein
VPQIGVVGFISSTLRIFSTNALVAGNGVLFRRSRDASSLQIVVDQWVVLRTVLGD